MYEREEPEGGATLEEHSGGGYGVVDMAMAREMEVKDSGPKCNSCD